MTPEEDSFIVSKIAGLFRSTTTINSFNLEYSFILFLISSLNSRSPFGKSVLRKLSKILFSPDA